MIPFCVVLGNPAWLVPDGPRLGSFEVLFRLSESELIPIFRKSVSHRFPTVEEVVDGAVELFQKHDSE